MLGFLGFLGFLGIPGILTRDWKDMLWLLWFAWFIYFFEAKKKRLFWIFLTLILLTQENMGIALSGIGLIYLFKKEYRKPDTK